MKRFLMLMVVLLMGIQWNSGYVQAAEGQEGTGSNSKVIYVPEEQISVSKSVEEDTFYESHSAIRNNYEEKFVFAYDLPELSADDFIGDDILLNTEDPVYEAEMDIDSTGEYQGFSYEVDQNGTIQLTGYQGTEKVVKVPSDIKGHRVVSITNCFNYDDVIEEIELPDTIYYIGFVGYHCSKLEKLTINAYNPEKTESVVAFTYMEGIFGDCQKLKTIVVNENENFKTFWAEDNVLYFGESDNISLVLYPAGKTDQDYRFKYAMRLGSAFEENRYIKNVIFEETIRSGSTPAPGVFYHCTNLESVTLQKGAPTVLTNWFDGCVSLKSFEIPDTVTKIGASAFNGCISLKKIVIPSSVTYIESSAFQDCSALESCTIYNDKITFEHIVIDGKEFETIWNGCNKLVLYCNRDSNTEKYARKFNITTAPIGSNSLSLNKTSVILYTGKALGSVTVEATTTGALGTVTWTTSNPKVATVENGKITAVGKGTATITATANGISKTVTVTVKNPVLTIKKGGKKFTKSKLTVKVKKKEVLKATVSPKNSGISIAKLTAKQKKIASVTLKKGKITIKGKKKGSFVLRIKSGKTTRKIKITVK